MKIKSRQNDPTPTSGSVTLPNLGVQLRLTLSTENQTVKFKPEDNVAHLFAINKLLDAADQAIAKLKAFSCVRDNLGDVIKQIDSIKSRRDQFKLGSATTWEVVSGLVNDIDRFERDLSFLTDHVECVGNRFYGQYLTIVQKC
jgi:hypothetical protein